MKNKTNKNEGVVTLITVLMVGTLALTLAFTAALGVLSQISKNRNIVSGDQLFYAADAAAREGAHQYINDYIASAASPTYSGGTNVLINEADNISISVTPLAWPYVEVTGDALNSAVERSVVYTVNIFPEGQAFDHAIYANDSLNISGSVEVDGDVFSNGDLNFNGNPPINGDVYSAGNADTSNNNLNGEAYSGVSPIAAPQVDTDLYKNEAQANGTYFTNPSDAENHLANPSNGDVVYVESSGQTDLQNANLTGAIVTTGDLKITGGTYTASQDHFAIIVLGDLHLTGNAVINGVVYVAGETTFSGGGATINGALISTQGLSTTNLTGNATINYSPQFIFVTEDNTTSSEDPSIVRWREE